MPKHRQLWRGEIWQLKMVSLTRLICAESSVATLECVLAKQRTACKTKVLGCFVFGLDLMVFMQCVRKLRRACRHPAIFYCPGQHGCILLPSQGVVQANVHHFGLDQCGHSPSGNDPDLWHNPPKTECGCARCPARWPAWPAPHPSGPCQCQSPRSRSSRAFAGTAQRC